MSVTNQLGNAQAIQNSSNQKILQYNKEFYNKQNKISSISSDLQDKFQSIIYPYVGFIRSNWKTKQGIIASINYGTATYISERVILTCIHNIYSEKHNRLCNQIFFVQGLQQGRINQRRVYKSRNQEFYKCQIPKKPLGIRPLSEQLCLVLLETQIQFQSSIKYPKIATLSEEQLNSELTMRLVGYPSAEYYDNSCLRAIQVKREDLFGKFYNLNGHIINYTMKTKSGQSGSPILAKNSQGQQIIVGIHTHKGLEDNYNSGLFFTKQILARLNRYLKEFQNEIQPYETNQQEQIAHEQEINTSIIQDEIFFPQDNGNESDQDCSSDISQVSVISCFDYLFQPQIQENQQDQQIQKYITQRIYNTIRQITQKC